MRKKRKIVKNKRVKMLNKIEMSKIRGKIRTVVRITKNSVIGDKIPILDRLVANVIRVGKRDIFLHIVQRRFKIRVGLYLVKVREILRVQYRHTLRLYLFLRRVIMV